MLLRAYFIWIEQEEMFDACYFGKQLKHCFFTEAEIYERLIFKYAQNFYQYRRNGDNLAIIEMQKCIGVMKLIQSDHLAVKYELHLKRLLQIKS